MRKVIISACLLGEFCRYDGKTKTVDKILQKYQDYEIIPFCPEAPLFGTPRDRISVLHVTGENRVIVDKTKQDVTKLLEDEINSFCDKNLHVDEIVLKSKSPSCGNQTTPILDEHMNQISLGDGIATSIFKKRYKNIIIKDENSLF
ncbi:DUF523 domain-containing protein [Sulfurimonas sp.]|nr:DUF523 domain-containing protein [Sulfurimonas sp.]